MSNAINEIRMKLWADVAAAYASASNSLHPEKMADWADCALEMFDNKFRAGRSIYIVQEVQSSTIIGAYDSQDSAYRWIKNDIRPADKFTVVEFRLNH